MIKMLCLCTKISRTEFITIMKTIYEVIGEKKYSIATTIFVS